MPAVTSGKVLVTGVNGFVAVWVAKTLLDAGFSVRGTVRSESKAGHLRTLFASAGDKFEVVIVDDITKEGAFDAYVGDVVAIAHTASPFHLKAVEPDELIVPALQGTLSVLRSARAHAPNLRRVIVLSSVAAVVRKNPNPAETLVLDEASWNEEDIVTVREQGAAAPAVAKYTASKTLAERAAWDFVEKEKAAGGLGWDLVTLCPPYVFGPVLHEVAKPELLNTSAQLWYFVVVKSMFDNETLATNGGSYVDVRDIAQTHVQALLKPEAAGNRFLVSSREFKFQDFVSAAHKIEPTLPAGNTSYDPSQAKFEVAYNNTRVQAVLGVNFRSMEETTKDTLEDFKAHGWL